MLPEPAMALPRYCVLRLRRSMPRLPLLKGDRTGRTYRQAVPETVAVIVTEQPCFSIRYADGAFMAGSCAKTASVAFFFINLDYLPFHDSFLPSKFCSGTAPDRAFAFFRRRDFAARLSTLSA